MISYKAIVVYAT